MECLESVLCFINPPNLDLYFIQVGNKAFADYIDTNRDVTHVNNKSAPHSFLYLDLMNLIIRRMLCRKDLVPITPGIHATVLLLKIWLIS
jgi:hypothetical protein